MKAGDPLVYCSFPSRVRSKRLRRSADGKAPALDEIIRMLWGSTKEDVAGFVIPDQQIQIWPHVLKKILLLDGIVQVAEPERLIQALTKLMPTAQVCPTR